jgi:acetyl-CoA carboxylase beta subunit
MSIIVVDMKTFCPYKEGINNGAKQMTKATRIIKVTAECPNCGGMNAHQSVGDPDLLCDGCNHSFRINNAAGKMTFTISKNGVTLWKGEYTSKQAAIAAYVKDLGTEALDYDDVDPDWKDELEVEAE